MESSEELSDDLEPYEVPWSATVDRGDDPVIHDLERYVVPSSASMDRGDDPLMDDHEAYAVPGSQSMDRGADPVDAEDTTPLADGHDDMESEQKPRDLTVCYVCCTFLCTACCYCALLCDNPLGGCLKSRTNEILDRWRSCMRGFCKSITPECECNNPCCNLLRRHQIIP